MKSITALALAGALAFGMGTIQANAGELRSQGRAGYRVVPETQNREATVALYKGERTTETAGSLKKEDENRHVIQARGRAGYRHILE